MSLGAVALAGPAVSPTAVVGAVVDAAATIASELVNASTFTVPQQDLKGSINQGGGGGGSGSGCKKPSPCGGGKKKSKCCGGGGGGCGGKKSKPKPEPSFNVVFKDFYAKKLKTAKVGKDGSGVAEAPWQNAEDAPKVMIDGTLYVWTTQWATSDDDTSAINCVKKDLEVTAVYRDVCGSPDEYTQYPMDSNQYDKIDQFSQDCTNEYNDTIKTCVNTMNDTEEIIGGYPTACKATYEYQLNQNSDLKSRSVEKHYPGIMNILPKYARPDDDMTKGECMNWDQFNDTKKCILNLQSCLIFQTRMMFNMDMEDIYSKLQLYVEDLMATCRNGEPIDSKLVEYKETIFTLLEDCQLENTQRWNEFFEDFKKYCNDIDDCFPSRPLQKEHALEKI